MSSLILLFIIISKYLFELKNYIILILNNQNEFYIDYNSSPLYLSLKIK